MDLEEELQDVAVADLVRIEQDLDRFRVGAMVAIGRIRNVAADFGNGSVNKTAWIRMK